MIVSDRDALIRKLEAVGYYRLCAYWHPFNEDLQQALCAFKDTYNQRSLIERLGFRAPAVVRRQLALTPAA